MQIEVLITSEIFALEPTSGVVEQAARFSRPVFRDLRGSDVVLVDWPHHITGPLKERS